jgi:hypothetical protein
MARISKTIKIQILLLIGLNILSCTIKKNDNKIETKINMEYQNKLNECKNSYPFNRWRESFSHGLEQYTEANCNKVKNIFDNLITELVSAGENIPEKDKVEIFKKAILSSNKLNDEIDGLIETGEREDLCELTDLITRACGIDPEKYGDGEGLATEWREW